MGILMSFYTVVKSSILPSMNAMNQLEFIGSNGLTRTLGLGLGRNSGSDITKLS